MNNPTTNLGGKRKLKYPLGSLATIGEETRKEIGAPSTLVKLTGTSLDGKKIEVTTTDGNKHYVKYANIGVLASRTESGGIVYGTVENWERAC